MNEPFDLSKFESYREGNRMEIKKASGELPLSLWETYSAFANSYGGVIILGGKENQDGSWSVTGLKDEERLKKEFWDAINNPNKVSINLLREKDVESFSYNGNSIMVIHVPSASREMKPIYINGDIFGGSFRRNWAGDYHCTKLQVKTMLRDQADDTIDMNVLDDIGLDSLNSESIRAYRNIFASLKPSHPFSRLSDDEFLRSLNAAAISKIDGKLHPTAAGLLMFGNEYDITRQFPSYFLDYRAEIDPKNRWDDRVQSSSGDWSGNVFDFYYRVYNKLKQSLNLPFKLKDESRIDDTPLHEAIREALSNCLVNADYYGSRGVVITLKQNKIAFANPGYSRTGKEQMLKGGVSDPRNRGLMKMFNLINIGERAGSGVPMIYEVWRKQGLRTPTIEEQFDPDRIILALPLDKRFGTMQINEKTHSKKFDETKAMVMEYLRDNGKSTGKELAEYTGLSQSRIRAILSKIDEIEAVGFNRSRAYRLK